MSSQIHSALILNIQPGLKACKATHRVTLIYMANSNAQHVINGVQSDVSQ